MSCSNELKVGTKELLTEGIFANKLDITKDRNEVYYLLTGKRNKAIYTNVIG